MFKQKSHPSLSHLKWSYIGLVVVILLLLCTTQVIIQFTLAHEQQERFLAAQINEQELRTQRMFYNVLLLQDPVQSGVNYLHINALIQQDEKAWEQAQTLLYQTALPSSAQVTTNKERSSYLHMEQTYRHIFALERQYHPASPDLVRPDVDTIYLLEDPYLQSITSVYNDIVSEADQEVVHVRIAEGSLFTLSILTVLVEFFFVARPGLRSVQDHFLELDAVIEDIEKKQEHTS